MSSKPRFVGKRVKLGDVCTIVSGATPKTKTNEYWGGEIRWVTPAELDGDSHYISDTEKHLTEAGYKSASLRMMPKGTVLLTTRAPIGKVAIAAEEMSCNQGFKNLVCSSAINNEFLYLYLKSRTAELQAMGRGATFKELSKKNVAGFEINLPAIDRQLDAVAKLTAVRSQIALAKQQHDQLDSLVKSRFVEMFASGGFPTVSFGDACLRVNNGITRRGNDPDGDIVLRLVELQEGFIDYAKPNRIRLTQKEKERFSLVDGDLLFARVNGNPKSVGRCASFSAINESVYHNDHVIRATFDHSKYNPEFLVFFMNSSKGRAQIKAAITTSAGQYTINQAGIKSIQVPLPPLTLQQEFATFVSQVDKSRFIAQQQIEKLQMLYDSLAQDYFGD